VYEDVLEMELDDVLALEAAVTGVSESRETFRNPRFRRWMSRTSLSRGNHRTYRLRILPHRIRNDANGRACLLGEGYRLLSRGDSSHG